MSESSGIQYYAKNKFFWQVKGRHMTPTEEGYGAALVTVSG